MSEWNTQRVEQLAPDTAAIKAAQGVAKPGKWRTLGRDKNLIWGECQGSGATPYQVRVDLTDATNKCTCPSHKLPCKHALALLLLLAGGAAFPGSTPPDFVAQWQAARVKRLASRARPPAPDRPADPEARARRIAKRESRIEAGLELLQTWLSDLIGQGLASAREQPASFWSHMAARLVDAQAPGLARRVRLLGECAVSSPDWQEQMLVGLGRLQLLADAYRRLEHLPEALAAEVRTQIGWTQPQEALLARDGLRASWQVVGQRMEQDEQMRVQHTWLCAGERCALLLGFARNGGPLPPSFPIGACLDAEVVYFDGAPPLRALIKSVGASTEQARALPAPADVAQVQARFCEVLATSPFAERWPVVLGPVIPWLRNDTCQLIDAAGRAMPTPRSFKHGWPLFALTQGEPCVLFGEWDGQSFEPLTVEHHQQLYALAHLSSAPVLSKVA